MTIKSPIDAFRLRAQNIILDISIVHQNFNMEVLCVKPTKDKHITLFLFFYVSYYFLTALKTNLWPYVAFCDLIRVLSPWFIPCSILFSITWLTYWPKNYPHQGHIHRQQKSRDDNCVLGYINKDVINFKKYYVQW